MGKLSTGLRSAPSFFPARLGEEASPVPTLSYILHTAPVITKVVPWLSAMPLSLYRHVQRLDVEQGGRFFRGVLLSLSILAKDTLGSRTHLSWETSALQLALLPPPSSPNPSVFID